MKVVDNKTSVPSRTVNGVVAGVLITITFLYIAAVFNVIQGWLSIYSVHGMSNFILLTATTALGMITYSMCVFSDPGAVPKEYEPTDVENETATVIQTKKSGKPRYCKKCLSYKPPRAHHCRRCQRCVTRMDHHCVWINNCVGHGNYRAFILMVLYLTAAATHALALFLALDAKLIAAFLGWDETSKALAALPGEKTTGSISSSGIGESNSSNNSTSTSSTIQSSSSTSTLDSLARKVGWSEHFTLHATIQILATAIALPIVVGLCMLVVWNFYLFLGNLTTIEYHEGVRTLKPRSSTKQQRNGITTAATTTHHHKQGQHIFDRGWHHSIHDVCGDNPCMWWLPVQTSAQGDGTKFATIWDDDAEST